LKHLRDRELRATALGRIIILLQRIEILKMPIFLDLIEDALENGFSVAVFVKFRETLQQICHILKCDTAIYGAQTAAERQACIDDFQANRRRLLVATIQAGGVGISLHDTTGSAPRMSIISPTWSAQDMVQTLGRVHRAGAKTPACQRIVFVAKTWEERICEIIEQKITNLHGLNDGDLIGLDVERQDIGALMGIQEGEEGGGEDPEPPSSEKVVWLR
jgi:SNF2 family DNA or RNA helicase